MVPFEDQMTMPQLCDARGLARARVSQYIADRMTGMHDGRI